MKIGIMTFWMSNDNYGQQLQSYALQQFLKKQGHQPFLIRYEYEKDIKKSTIIDRFVKFCSPKNIIRYSISVYRKCILRKSATDEKRNFDEFKSKYISSSSDIYSSYDFLVSSPPEADAYLVGSDQVWNNWNYDFNRFENRVHAFFLDFGDSNVKRIAYAASWGGANLSNDYKSLISKLITKFDYVSVREKSGLSLCGKCEYNKAEWVCDPTLLLKSSDYRNLYFAEKLQKPKNKYIFLYLLGNECSFNIKTLYSFAKSKNLDVIYVSGNSNVDKYEKTYATIQEWLFLIDNAQYVVTNSFHCCIFSSLFEKLFGVIPLTGRDKGMNDRFDSLFELLKIESRYLDESFSILSKEYVARNVEVSRNFLGTLNN